MDVQSYTIGNGKLTATLTNYGASLTDLRVPWTPNALVLGFPNVADYVDDGQFMGAVIGRYANRIRRGQATIDGWPVQLEQNEVSGNHLHGGQSGYGVREWGILAKRRDLITFDLKSPDGDAGFPGDLTAFATYEIVDQTTLRLTLSARCNQTTLINLCHHPYFDFFGKGRNAGYQLQINATEYLPSDKNLLPTGQIINVTNTNFDYQIERDLRSFDYNNTYCLSRTSQNALHCAARLCGGTTAMELWTTQPGLHLYNGYKLRPTSIGHADTVYAARSGICLEAQAWPDSPNNAGFPSTEVTAGTFYQHVTDYRFSQA